jgi:segregation and condensation protein B
MSQEKLKNIIEAALMVSTQPLSVKRILSLFEADQTLEPERDDIRNAIVSLQDDYKERGIELTEVASGFRFQARDEYAEWVNHLFDERPPRYSRALLETLAIIAYRQPITRGEIEEIRGVSVSSTIVKTLQEREWVKVVGHRDVPGKPSLLATTKSFLDYFNLKKLSDLPSLEDIKDFDSINPDLFEELEGEAVANTKVEAVAENAGAEENINDDTNTVEEEYETPVDDNVVLSEYETETDTDAERESVESVVAEHEEHRDSEEAITEEGATVIPFSN